MSLVLAECHPLKPDVLEEGRCTTSDDDLDRLVMLPPDVALPAVPSLVQYLVCVVLLELEADEQLRRIVHFGIDADEESLVGIDAAAEGRVEAVRILPEVMELGRLSVFLRAVLDLKAVLVGRAVLGGGERRRERIHQDAQTLARRRDERDPEWSLVRG